MAELLPFFTLKKREYIVDSQLLVVLVYILEMLYTACSDDRTCMCLFLVVLDWQGGAVVFCFLLMLRSLSFGGGGRRGEMLWCSWLALQDGATEVGNVPWGVEAIFVEIL
jgi:hypothetical protein